MKVSFVFNFAFSLLMMYLIIKGVILGGYGNIVLGVTGLVLQLSYWFLLRNQEDEE